MDECASAWTCRERQSCVNTQGDFECHCAESYEQIGSGADMWCRGGSRDENCSDCTFSIVSVRGVNPAWPTDTKHGACVMSSAPSITTCCVTEKRLFVFGVDAADTEVTSLSGITGERASSLIPIPDGWPVFDETFANSVYVSVFLKRN